MVPAAGRRVTAVAGSRDCGRGGADAVVERDVVAGAVEDFAGVVGEGTAVGGVGAERGAVHFLFLADEGALQVQFT